MAFKTFSNMICHVKLFHTRTSDILKQGLLELLF